jgi:hypothetical protein
LLVQQINGRTETVPSIAFATVLAWPIMVARSIHIAGIFSGIAWKDLGAGAPSEGVPIAAVTVV